VPHDSAATLFAVARAKPAVLAFVVATLAPAAYADTIVVKSAELRLDEDTYVLSAEFELAFNPTLEEAIQKGVPLYFVFEFELLRPRWYWVDEKVLSLTTQYRVSYNALTRQYRVAIASLARRSMRSTTSSAFCRASRRARSRASTSSSRAYATRPRLACARRQRLPKPFQVNALASRDWTLQSEWYRWSFTRERLLPSRRMRWLLLVLACLGAIALFLLATASANTELFAKSIDTLLFVNGVLGALLMAVVGAQLWQLWLKRVRRVRLAPRGAPRAGVRAGRGAAGRAGLRGSVLFIGRSIESWFDVRVDRALEGGSTSAATRSTISSRKRSTRRTRSPSRSPKAAAAACPAR
jgi:hypothetical protein